METILLVDNGPEQSSIVRALARTGYAVIAADDGPSALSLVRENAPLDLVIISDGIPGFADMSFLTALRKRAPGLPVIMLAAHGSIEGYFKALSLGAFEYLNKPVALSDLGRIIKIALGKTRTLEYAKKI